MIYFSVSLSHRHSTQYLSKLNPWSFEHRLDNLLYATFELLHYFLISANIPEIDLTIALSATSASSDRTFTLMKRTVNKIIEDYGINRIHYSIIVFGRETTNHFNFSSTQPTKAKLIKLVDGLPESSGSPDLVSALEEVRRVYELQTVRPNAKKVLVVILDDTSVNEASALNRVVTVLVNKSIMIIGVGVGPSVSSSELRIITREVENIIRVNLNKPTDELAKEIIQAIFRSKLLYVNDSAFQIT